MTVFNNYIGNQHLDYTKANILLLIAVEVLLLMCFLLRGYILGLWEKLTGLSNVAGGERYPLSVLSSSGPLHFHSFDKCPCLIRREQWLGKKSCLGLGRQQVILVKLLTFESQSGSLLRCLNSLCSRLINV